MSQDALPEPPEINTGASFVIFILLIALMVGGGLMYSLMKRRSTPPPPEIAGDPLLVEGRELFLSRCVSCHGPGGRGDGPIARSLTGPPPGDLTDTRRKHGDRPEQVVAVIRDGVPNTSMAPWKGAYSNDQIRALAAYTYYLASRPVPAELRR